MSRLLPAATACFAASLTLSAPSPAESGEIVLDRAAVPGGLIIGKVIPKGQVRLNRELVRTTPTGVFVIGFGRDDRGVFELAARFDDGTTAIERLHVEKRQYPTESIDGLPANMVTPSAEEQSRIRRENGHIARLRRTNSDATWFAETFIWPVKGRISGVYGSRRILNGEKRQPHYGIDIAAPQGTLVAAPAPGRVIMAESDLYYTGGTVMLDHGHGLTSLYSHLSDINVAIDDQVGRGQTIGSVGATGRASGPHLDWRINLFDTRLDPALLAGPMRE